MSAAVTRSAFNFLYTCVHTYNCVHQLLCLICVHATVYIKRCVSFVYTQLPTSTVVSCLYTQLCTSTVVSHLCMYNCLHQTLCLTCVHATVYIKRCVSSVYTQLFTSTVVSHLCTHNCLHQLFSYVKLRALNTCYGTVYMTVCSTASYSHNITPLFNGGCATVFKVLWPILPITPDQMAFHITRRPIMLGK